MISKFIKKIIEKKNESIADSQESTPKEPLSEDGLNVELMEDPQESTPKEQPSNHGFNIELFNIELMDFKTFIHHESAYRHQEIVIRRATESNRLTLGEVLSQLFDEKKSSIKSMAVAYRLANLGNDVSETIIEDANDVWNYDLFSCILKRKIDNHYAMGLYHETTLIINGSSKKYVMMLKSLGGIDTVKYMRVSLLVLGINDFDDGMSLQDQNVSISQSFILSYSELDDNLEFAKYDQVEDDIKRKQDLKQELNEIEQEYIDGQFEFKGYWYIGYGKWLFSQNRYYDAFCALERIYNYIRTGNVDKQNQDLKTEYYEICNIMGQCLSKMGREDEAAFYFKQGVPGLSIDSPNDLALSYARLGNPIAIQRMNAWVDFAIQMHGYLPEGLKQFCENVTFELTNYKKHIDESLNQSPNYSGRITIGILLKILMDLNKKNIAPCMFVYDYNSGKFLERIEDIDKIWNCGINEVEQPNRVYILSCSHAHFKIDEDKDMSILCHNAPLVISSRKISGNKTSATMRVDIIRSNFYGSDDKIEFVRTNTPLTYSIRLGACEDICFSIDNDGLLIAIRKSIDYMRNFRCLEAYRLAKWIFECASNRLKSSDGLSYTSNDKLLWGIFFEASYIIGFCLMEMNKKYKSAYYLEIANHSMQYHHIQEYINFLCNSKDPESFSTIENVMKNSPRPQDEVGLNEWNNHMAFLKRRKVYVLIEDGHYEEAKNYIIAELLNDPLCKDFAQGELNYINQKMRVW